MIILGYIFVIVALMAVFGCLLEIALSLIGSIATIYWAGTPEKRPRRLYPTRADCGLPPPQWSTHRDH